MRGYPPPPIPSLAGTFLLLSLTAVACGDAANPAPQRLWTMADLQLSSHQGTSCTNPGGLPCNYFVDTGVNGNDVLQFKLAFAEGEPMGYMTTDFWSNYDQIWLEPMYILVTSWNDKAPAANRLLDGNGQATGPIFSIGPQSGFYSPYWQIFYVEVPADTADDQYTAARQLFDDHLVMHPGPNRFASIGPSSVFLPSADDISMKAAPGIAAYLKDGPSALPGVVLSSKALTGWLDGTAVSYVDFGNDNFDVDATQAIRDVPLFLFKKYDTGGNLVLAGAPNVGGVAPLFSGTAARVSAGNRPQFGALWRLHIVTLPPAARVFLKDDEDLAIEGGGDATLLDDKVLRVALDGKCFDSLKTPSPLDDTCVWLDSQAAIEDNLGPKAITRTALLPACPFVMFRGRPVPYQ